jgi:hypothetical protein
LCIGVVRARLVAALFVFHADSVSLDWASWSVASGLMGLKGSLSTQAITSDSNQTVFPPMARDRGNMPFRIHAQIVGADTVVIARISALSISRSRRV